MSRPSRMIHSLWVSAAVGAGISTCCPSARAEASGASGAGAAGASAESQEEREPPQSRPPEPEPESWREPNRLVAATEVGLIVALGGVEYWTRHDGRPRYRLSTWKDRFSTTKWLILDTSTFATNYSYHTLAGSGYHLATRTSGLGVLESALYSLAASFVWEYIVEYREKVDLNDMIFTTPAGVAFGEHAHKLGQLAHQHESGVGHWTLGFPQLFNSAIGGVDSEPDSEIGHRFQVAAGASHARLSAPAAPRARHGLYQLRVSSELSAVGDRTAAGWRGFADGNFTSLDLMLSAGAGGARGTYVLSDTFLAGWRYRDAGERRPSGEALAIGTATAVRYRHERYGGWRERLGVAHLPGLAADGEIWGERFRLEGTLRLHPDYGGVGVLSHLRWADAHPAEVGLSTVEQRGYYHAYGVSGRLGAALSLPGVRVGGELFAGRYWPHRGRDKRRDELTVEQSIASRVADYELFVRGQLPARVFVEARMQGRRRWERFEELEAGAQLRRFGVEVGTTF